MSVQYSSSVSGVVQRRAEVDDVSTFNTLLNASGGPALFRATFGQYNYPAMIEGSISSLISVAEEEGKCLGFLVLNDSPTVSTENDTFLATVSSVATLLPDVKATNTLFLNFFLVDETSRYDSDKVSFDLVHNAFVASPQADYIIWLCPSKVRLGFWMEDNFVHVPLPKSEDESGNGTALGSIPFGVKLLYMHRNAFIPKLLVRTARVEDNDDLLPILRSSNPQVVSGQSDFFLADLIQSQDERNKFLVGVYKDSPVGMLATSLDVNVSLLTRIFDIDGYSDIIVAKEKKLHPPPLFISVMGEIRAVEKNTMRNVITDMNCLFVDAEEVLSRQSSSEEKSGEYINEEEETKFARLAMDELKNFLVGLLAQAEGKNEHPTAIVVSGFPRNDTEAHEMSRGYLNFDVLLEFSDYAKQKAGDREDDDGDVYLKKHLDAVEALHSFTDAQPPTATPWYLVTLGADGGPNDKDFQTCVSNIVDQRAREVDRILALDEEEPPKANAFAVTVFCMDVDFETRGVDLLRVAFEDNPKLDYCLYMVSNSAPPTKLTASMVMVKQRVGVTFDQTLYIVQRDAIIAADLLQVVRLDVSQMSAVEKFTTPLHSFGNARAQLLNSCVESLKQNDIDLKDNPPEVSFAIMMGADMVGILTASRNYLGSEDIVWMRCNYHLDEVINFDRHRLRAQAQITNFVINPVYSKWTRYIIREVMRKYMKTVLYYHNPVDDVPPSEILEELIAVPPRRRMQPNLGTSLPMIEKPSSNCVNVESPLMYITKRQITELKVCVTKKVVVIGGGSASYALLEKLLYTSHLHFPNIQLVMELPPKAFKITQAADPSFDYSEKCSGDLTFEDADDPSMQELTAMGIGHRISVVRGRLTDIDRANKAIVISDEVVNEYDLLVVASSTKDCSTKKYPTTSGTHPLHCAYRGMFGLGDAVSDARALEWVLRQSADRPHVVVCGSDMETIGVAGALLSRRVDPNRITVVISLPKIADVVHPFVVESALRSLRGSGVFIKMGFEIVDVNLTKFGSVESVQLRCLTSDPTIESTESGGADSMVVVIPCYSLLCCGTKYCDADVFAAINESGIVYDGGVVVDKSFATNDPNIYAVGSFSRFSRIYREEPIHSRHSARELGLYVGQQLLQKHLDPLSPDYNFQTPGVNTLASFKSGSESIPKFKFPKTVRCTLPNGRTFFHTSLYASESSSDAAMLVTGDLNADRISVLKLDSLGMVLELVSVGKGEIEAKNLGRLPGWHESFLNGAIASYEGGLVEEWVEFLRGDWATVLYHDTFPELADSLRSALNTDKYAFSLVDLMLDVADKSSEDQEILLARKQELGPRGEKMSSITYKMIENCTLEFLRKNKSTLPRFFIPQPNKGMNKK